MTLQIPRDAETTAGALAKIVQTLGNGNVKAGVALAAQITGKSRWTVRAWMDPHKDAEPGLSCAAALDTAYFTMTGEEPPLYRLYGDTVSVQTHGAHGSHTTDVKDQMLRLTGDMGELAMELTRAEEEARKTRRGFSAGSIAVVTAKADRIRDRLAGIVKGVRSWSEAAR
ncbi:hypothetical protein FW320_12710 [Azospirillum sp. Vi22]|uniref:hypothetical protein n=1 Tax=Azospirillum baldaniorum TaxID=1064539 RepID=UPI00157B74BB|nr:hypothetical protein [Azospirillum baldaniorum]NUB07032.1 hypothetical protein [Azospirillum baldaniorum]